MNPHLNRSGLYCGGWWLGTSSRFLCFIPPGCPPWHEQDVPIIRARRFGGIGWGPSGARWQGAAENTALSILAHAAPASVAAAHYCDFANQVIAALPSGRPFALSTEQITQWLANRGVDLLAAPTAVDAETPRADRPVGATLPNLVESTVSEIAQVVGDLRRLSERDPQALARRDQILAAKTQLVEVLQAHRDHPAAVNPASAGHPPSGGPVQPGTRGRTPPKHSFGLEL